MCGLVSMNDLDRSLKAVTLSANAVGLTVFYEHWSGAICRVKC